MKLFIALDKNPDDVDNPCYVNILNIDYIIRDESNTPSSKTEIRFKGSKNQINTDISTREVMRRINIALNGAEVEEIIDRFNLIDMED